MDRKKSIIHVESGNIGTIHNIVRLFQWEMREKTWIGELGWLVTI